MKTIVKQNRSEIEELKRTNMELKTQLEAVDCRGRLKNIVFSGLSVSDTDSDTDLVCNLINSKLEIDVSSSDLEKCRRLENNKSKKAIIIVSFVSQILRDSVFKAASKLKGSNVYINADLPLETRIKQSELRRLARKAKECGYSDVKIRNTGQLLDGTFHLQNKLPQLLGNPLDNNAASPPDVFRSPAGSMNDMKNDDSSSSSSEEEEDERAATGGLVSILNRMVIRPPAVNVLEKRNKIHQFTTLIENYAFLIVFGTESWLDSSFLDNEIFPTYLNFYRKDRDKFGGGVFIAIYAGSASDIFELLCVKINNTVNGTNTFLIVAYRPPNNDFFILGELYDRTSTDQHVSKNFLIAGDLNLPHVDWMAATDRGGDTQTRVNYLINDGGFNQIVNVNTRKNNLLDVFLIRPESLCGPATVCK
ncbi:hypothetical protein B566_EDAN011872, partial [Ephemera danica]